MTFPQRFGFFFKAGVTEPLDTVSSTSIITVNTLSIATAIIALIGPAIIYFFIAPHLQLLLPGTIESFCFIGIVYLNYRHRHKLASILCFLLQNLVILYFGLILDKTIGVQQMCFFLIGLAVIIFKDKITRIICAALTVSTLVILEINYQTNLITPIVDSSTGLSIRNIVVPAIWILNGLVVVLYGRNLKIARNQAEKRSEEKSLILQVTNHEVRNPLHLLSGILKRYMSGKRISYQQMKAMHNACEDIIKVVNNVLTWSSFKSDNQEMLNNRPVNIATWLEEFVETYKHLGADKGVKVDVSISDGIKNLLIDEQKLQRIVINIFTNAIKFTAADSHVSITARWEDSNLKIAINDQGGGIKESKVGEIFNPYFTTPGQPVPASGLGLSIAKQTALLMGGDIEVHNDSKGAVFTIILPVEETELLPDPKEIETEEVPLEGVKVLLIDDNEMILTLTKLMLKDMKLEVATANSAETAFLALNSFSPDIIICDIQLPGTDGIQFIDELKSNDATSHIPVVLLTGDPFALHNIPANAAGIIIKPISSNELNKQIIKNLQLNESRA